MGFWDWLFRRKAGAQEGDYWGSALDRTAPDRTGDTVQQEADSDADDSDAGDADDGGDFDFD